MKTHADAAKVFLKLKDYWNPRKEIENAENDAALTTTRKYVLQLTEWAKNTIQREEDIKL